MKPPRISSQRPRDKFALRKQGRQHTLTFNSCIARINFTVNRLHSRGAMAIKAKAIPNPTLMWFSRLGCPRGITHDNFYFFFYFYLFIYQYLFGASFRKVSQRLNRITGSSLLYQHMHMVNSISCLPENTKQRRHPEHMIRHVVYFPNVYHGVTSVTY